MDGLRRGTLTQMNPGLLLIWDNFKPLQDGWLTKGHTHTNEPRINALHCYLYGTILNYWILKKSYSVCVTSKVNFVVNWTRNVQDDMIMQNDSYNYSLMLYKC